MRNIFAFDVKSRSPKGRKATMYDLVDGQKFRVAGAADRINELKKKYQDQLPPKNWADHMKPVLYYLGSVSTALLFLFPIALVIYVIVRFQAIRTDSTVLYPILIPGVVIAVIAMVCYLLALNVRKHSTESQTRDQVRTMSGKYEKELCALLKIPDDAILIDILSFGYQWSHKKAIQQKTMYGRSFTNTEYHAWIRAKKLYLSDGYDLFAIPMGAILSVSMVEEKGNAELSRWNKKESPDDEAFKPWHLRTSNGHVFLPVAALASVEIRNTPENFCFYLPGYDAEALCRLIDKNPPKVNLPEKPQKKKK